VDLEHHAHAAEPDRTALARLHGNRRHVHLQRPLLLVLSKAPAADGAIIRACRQPGIFGVRLVASAEVGRVAYFRASRACNNAGESALAVPWSACTDAARR